MNEEKVEKTSRLVEEIIRGQASREEKEALEEYFSNINYDNLFKQCYLVVEKTILAAESLKKSKDEEARKKSDKTIDGLTEQE